MYALLLQIFSLFLANGYAVAEYCVSIEGTDAERIVICSTHRKNLCICSEYGYPAMCSREVKMEVELKVEVR